MQYTETLDWILDKHGAKLGDEAAYKENIDFVHSLGLKCDCVGWSTLDLASSRAEEILAAIARFCRQNGWRARGMYTRTYAGESDWYEIRFAQAKEEFSKFNDFREVPDEHGGMVTIRTVKAFYEPNPAPRWCTLDARLVPDRFRAVCLHEGWTDVEFCWAQDKGKYAAPQYFHIYPRHAVAHSTDSTSFGYSAKHPSPSDAQTLQRMQLLGGSLPRLTKMFYDLMVFLPYCYLASELPSGGFSSAYTAPDERRKVGYQRILVHRDMAEVLLRERALQPSALMPVPVLDAFLPGYVSEERTHQPVPAKAVREELLRAYEALKAADRPVRAVAEKEAVKLLRAAKKARKDDFAKAMPKAKAEALANTPWGPLAPYWLIAQSGYLSDEYEYELLSHERAIGETEAFHRELAAEELLTDKPDGVVIAACADGDKVLLLTNGTVIRFSHEATEETNCWPSLAQFMADAIQEGE